MSDSGDDAADPRVSTVPLKTENGDEVVIAQQNVGPGNQVGHGEFKTRTSVEKDPGEAAAEQAELDRETLGKETNHHGDDTKPRPTPEQARRNREEDPPA